VGVAGLLWPPNPVWQLRQQYRDLRTRLVSDVLRSLQLAGRPGAATEAEANRRTVREHSEQADAAVAAIGGGRTEPTCAGRDRDASARGSGG
jgi:hypothetical protein